MSPRQRFNDLETVNTLKQMGVCLQHFKMDSDKLDISGYFNISGLVGFFHAAMVCLIGREPDSNAARRYRWVIPVEDPCKCTEIRPGGINNRTPGRHFKVIYFDTLLVSKSPMEIRKWLNCSGKKTFAIVN